jgi:alkanesulfonate monooxygenase SsuD/methylene tetrahydromethanopterin reductase-like flavin-dependent oxidoreductase (luciferase family)
MDLSLGLTGFAPLAATLPLVQAAEAVGLRGVWSCEHVGFHDAVVPSAAYTQTTRRLEIGLTGLSITGRHPGLTAMELASLAELAPGRVRVQVGTGEPSLMRMIDGAVQQGALAQVRQFVTTLRALLAGEVVTTAAPTYRCEGLRLAFPGAPPAIDVMAMRPQMLRLAAQVGDGVSLGAWSSRAYLRGAVQQVEAELAAQGRDRAAFRISAFVLVALAPERDQACAQVAGSLAMLPPEAHAALPLLAQGVALPDAALVDDTLRRSDLAALVPLYAPCAPELGLVATPEDLDTALAPYTALGLDELIVTFVPGAPLPAQLAALTALAEAHARLEQADSSVSKASHE